MILTQRRVKSSDSKTSKTDDSTQSKSGQQLLPLERPKRTGLPEIHCYFCYHNRGPVGHADLLVEFTYFWTWHFTEELRRHIIPKEQFVYDEANRRFWLHPDATHAVYEECIQQRYTCIGYRPRT